MPYKLQKRKGEYCVINSDTGENKGCSKSRAMGIRHMRAMYAAEGGAKMGKKELEEVVTKSLASFNTDNPDESAVTEEEIQKCMAMEYIPYNVASFKDLDAYRETQEQLEEMGDELQDFQSLVNNVMYNPDVTDKAAAVKALADEFATRVKSVSATDEEKAKECADCQDKPQTETLAEHIVKMVKEVIEDVVNVAKGRNDNNEVMIWKSANGQYNWIGRYSSNFRDRDNPPEIISASAHKSFVEKVDKGLADLPVLEIWHNKAWEIGKSTWVAYDDSGFPIVGGYFYPEAYGIAEQLKEVSSIAMSHGMPASTIKRDAEDPTIITEYESKEVSILPPFAAANEMAQFYVQKEADMPIDKRQKIIESKWATDEQLSALEARNVADADKAKAEGVQSKEVAEPVVETPAETPAPVTEEVPAPPFDAQAEIAKLREDMTAAVEAVKKIAQHQEESDKGLTEIVQSLKEVSNSLNDRARRFIPSASLEASLAKSVVGQKGAELTKKETSDLLAGRPTETPANTTQTIGVPFLDRMFAAEEAAKKAAA